MKRFLDKRFVWVLTALFFTLVCCFSSQAAEKKKVKWTKKTKQLVSRVDHHIGDAPKHRISQWVRIDDVTYLDSDLGAAEEWVYMQSDSTAGTGTHNGHSIYRFEDGDKYYSKWEGSHKTIVKEGGSWELMYEGRYLITGGTGKFENIKGEGVYTGTMTDTKHIGSGETELEY